jgi:single-strand DNA-binding protein
MYQKLTIVGNLGRDPELRYTPSGQAVCNFSVATSRRWTGSDGNSQEETVWFRVSTWGKLAETCNQYLSKGRQVFVEGRMTVDKETGGPRVWQAQDGSWRASYEVTALEVKFLGNRGDSGGFDSGGGNAAGSADAPAVMEDEIPF